MKNTTYHVLGVMSGTSLDGVDIAEIFFDLNNRGGWDFRIGVAETIPYSEVWKNRLKEAVSFSENELYQLNKEYTFFLAEMIKAFISRHKFENLDAICSHGHTTLHQPETGVTLQIGNLPEISKILKQTVVCDFRVQDVKLGGQGAPLVPIGDRLLFSEYDYCLNLGGFANCSFISEEKSIAYDICPVNIVMNPLAEKKGMPFDYGGKLARSGTLDATLLSQLDSLPFYNQLPPKSLGLEWVQNNIDPILNRFDISIENKLHTLVIHMAKQLASQFNDGASVLVTGGGSYNAFLLECVQAHKNVELFVPESKLVEFKEALIFGLLGILRLRNEVNCLASVTGASMDHSSGVIYK